MVFVFADAGTNEGLDGDQSYTYDLIGNLTQNGGDGIQNIEWNIYGKVKEVRKTNGTIITYKYDGTGNRIYKEVRTTTTNHTNYYLRDASGNVLAIYEKKTDQTLAIKEIPIYGGSRLGQYRPKTDTKKTALGQRIYEFSNHLGNVLVTLSDNKVPQTDGTYKAIVLSASDYYPFGMAMKERTFSNENYRYGFNGQEQSDELDENGNSYTAEYWQYDARLGRRWNVDPVVVEWESGYATFRNNPIALNDPNGDCSGPDCPDEPEHVYEIDKEKAGTSMVREDGTRVTFASDQYEVAILKGKIIYTRNYGWVDKTHAFSGSPKDKNRGHIGAPNLWKQVNEEQQHITLQLNGGYVVNYGQDARVISWIPRIGISKFYWVRSGLTTQQKREVAVAIFQEISKEFENMQGLAPWSGSSFEPADLPSNMLGLYIAMKPELNEENVIEVTHSNIT